MTSASGLYLRADGSRQSTELRPRRLLDECDRLSVHCHNVAPIVPFPGEGIALQQVTGLVAVTTFCNPPRCPVNATLRTHYEAWHANMKATSDFSMGSMTLTPSFVAFGGAARNDHGLSQTVTFSPLFASTLTATASEKSTDLFGSRVGRKAKIDLAPWLALGVGGDLGFPTAGSRWWRMTTLKDSDRGFPPATK